MNPRLAFLLEASWILWAHCAAQSLSITTGVIGKDSRFLLQKPSPTQIDSLRQRARAGDAQAQMALVEYYELMELRPDSARFYLQMAVKAGLPEAQYLLGIKYLRGVEGPKRPAEGKKLLEQAAAQNHILAMRVLYEVLEPPDSLSPLYVKVLPHKASEAFTYARKAAELGDAPSMHRLGWYYARGKGTMQNDSLAELWLLAAAQKGYRPAQIDLAEWYITRHWDAAKARHWAQTVLSQEYASAEEQIRAQIILYYADNLPLWLKRLKNWLIQPPYIESH